MSVWSERMSDWRLFRIPGQPVTVKGEVHIHETVGPRPFDSDLEPFSYDSKRPLGCDKCETRALIWRETLRQSYIERLPHLGKDWNW